MKWTVVSTDQRRSDCGMYSLTKPPINTRTERKASRWWCPCYHPEGFQLDEVGGFYPAKRLDEEGGVLPASRRARRMKLDDARAACEIHAQDLADEQVTG